MFLELNLKSTELKKDTCVNLLIPNVIEGETKPFKTLWLLHGRAGDQSAWMRYSSIERYARMYNLAVVMPNGDRSWYADTSYGANYFSFIAKELPMVLTNLFKGYSSKREDNIVGGLSMGGYGALKLAMTLPEQYGACISLSGSLDITRKGRDCDMEEWRAIFGSHLKTPNDLEGSEHDLFALAAKLKEENKPIPDIYMWCGENDYLLNTNYEFTCHLSKLEIPYKFEVSEGDHSWRWWDLHVQDALKYILTK